MKTKFSLEDTTTDDKPTVITGNSTYDHILRNPTHTQEYNGSHGLIAFDEEVFADDDDAARTAVSDHRPVWIDVVIPSANDD